MKIDPTDLETFKTLIKKIKISTSEFDDFLSNNPHIYRSVRGHAFEAWFDREMKERGVVTTVVGGDSVVDRIINKKHFS